MPQLKITNYLTNDIMRNVAELYKPHIDKTKEQDPVMTEMFYDIIVPEEGGLREALNNLPQCFVMHGDEFPFRGVLVATKKEKFAFTHYRSISGPAIHEFNIRFASRRALPCQKFLPHCGMGETAKVDSTEPRWQPFLKLLDNHLANVALAEKQHKDAELSVEILLERHKTIQPILRQWPALWDLLPHAAQETIAGKASGIQGVQPWPVYNNPIPSDPGIGAAQKAGANDALQHLTMMLVTKKINERA